MRNQVKYVYIDIPINTGTNFGLMLSDGLFFLCGCERKHDLLNKKQVTKTMD